MTCDTGVGPCFFNVEGSYSMHMFFLSVFVCLLLFFFFFCVCVCVGGGGFWGVFWLFFLGGGGRLN